MTSQERIHQDIPGSGTLENPYNLQVFPMEPWDLPNKPIEALAGVKDVQTALRNGEEIALNYNDSTFIISLGQREQENEVPFVFVKVDVMMPVDINKVEAGAIRLNLSEIHSNYGIAANIIFLRFEEALGLREKKY